MSAAGILVAFAVITGSIIGILQGQPSIGFLFGLGVGVALAILATLIQNRRRP